MGDGDHLRLLGESGESPTDLDGRGTADAGVDLVEHEGGNGVGRRDDDLDREHHARQLAAGRALGDGAGFGTGMRREQDGDVVAPVGALGSRRHGHLQACVRHRQRVELGGHGLAEPDGGLAPGGGEGVGAGVELRPGRVALGGEAFQTLPVIVELGQPCGTGLPQCQRFRQRTVLTDEDAERGPAFLDGCELVRAGLIEVGEEAGEHAGGVGDPVADVGQGLGDLRQLRVRHALDRPACLRDQRRRIGLALLVREGAVGQGGREPQLLRVREAFGAGRQLLILTLFGSGGLDQGQVLPQPGGLLGAPVAVRGDVDDLGVERAPVLERGLILLQRSGDGLAAEAIEGVALRGRRSQPQLLGLPVHHDELVGERGQHTRRCGAAADARATAAFGAEGARDVQLRSPGASRLQLSPASATMSATSPVSGTIPHRPPTPAPRPCARRRSRRAVREAGRDR